MTTISELEVNMDIYKSLKVRGFFGTIQLAFLRLFNFDETQDYIISRMFDLRRFDRAHCVDTAGLIELGDIEIPSPNKADGTRYGGVTPWLFKEILGHIPINHRSYIFIDIGSGKGAALLYASEYPFSKIIGVEFAPSLHQIAIQNLRTVRGLRQQCTDIRLICEDASIYAFPRGPWILFFNVPFGTAVWTIVCRNLEEAIRANEDISYLVHVNYGWRPEAAELVDGLSFLRCLHSNKVYKIYEIAHPNLDTKCH